MARPTGLPALEILDPIAWQDKPVPERRWLVPGLIPVGSVTMLSGDGGLGKSLLALQLLAACALGAANHPRKWLGREVMGCRAFGMFCEDDADELHRRLGRVLEHYGRDFADLENLTLCSRVGLDTALMRWEEPWQPGDPTTLYGKVLNHVTNAGTQLVVLDSLHDVFPGDEIKRTHARQFINTPRELATETDGAVLLTAHPSLTGRNSRTGESGSTSWNAAVRSRLYLVRADGPARDRPDSAARDERVLRTAKSNYGADGGEIRLRWREGVLEAQDEPSGMVASIRRGKAEKAFLACLDAITAQGRYVTDGATSPRFAPKQFAAMAEANGYKMAELRAAMERLFTAGTIKISTARGADRHKVKMIVKAENEAK